MIKYSFITEHLRRFESFEQANLLSILNDWGAVKYAGEGIIFGFKTTTSPQGVDGVTRTRLEDGLRGAAAKGIAIPPFRLEVDGSEPDTGGTFTWDGQHLTFRLWSG